MISIETYYRAKTIFVRGDIRFDREGSNPPYFLHFLVKQRGGEWTDVWRKINIFNGMEIVEWSCNAVSDVNGKEWGCVFNVTDKSKPFCSHTKAVELLLEALEK